MILNFCKKSISLIKIILPTSVLNFLYKIKNIISYAYLDLFLNDSIGVIHVGANSGDERDLYKKRDLDVIWIEPIPEVFNRLESNLINFDRQKAIRALITDKDDVIYNFKISNNKGLSSSILDLYKHKDVWNEVDYIKEIKLKSTTLPTLIENYDIKLKKYDSLILDTQGSELLILKGCGDLLNQFKYIKVEVADFEAYKGCCIEKELIDYLNKNKFYEIKRIVTARVSGIGKYYDILFKKELSK